MTTWTERIERYLSEGRTVSGGKGDSAIKNQENQQAGFNTQLQNVFTQQFGAQSGILNFLQGKLTNQINNPTGFSPAQMAALNTNNTENSAKSFANAQAATQNAEAARGGSALPSGVSAQLAAGNANAAAASNAQGANAIQLANASQQQNNYWNAVQGLSGVANQENPTGFAGLFNQGSSNVGNLGVDYNQTQQSQLESTLGGALGGVAGAVGQYYGAKGR